MDLVGGIGTPAASGNEGIVAINIVLLSFVSPILESIDVTDEASEEPSPLPPPLNESPLLLSIEEPEEELPFPLPFGEAVLSSLGLILEGGGGKSTLSTVN